MAIEQYGESILAGVRSRQEQDRKRREKEGLKTALTGLGVTIGYKVGNQVLANNMSNFLNNEKVFAAKAQYKSALNNQASVLGLQKEIEKSGMSTTDFFAKSMRPQFEARAKEVVPFGKIGEAGAYDEMVTAEVRKMAEQQAEAYNKALEAANNLSSEEDFTSMIALNAKEAKATNILDAATRTVGRFFTGRSAQDVEEEALNAITNGRMSENAEKMSIFMEEYDRTKDLVSAFDFANFVVPDVPEEERFVIDKQTTYVELGNVVYKTTKSIKTDRNTGAKTEEPEITKIAEEFNDPESLKAAALKARITTFNYGKDARNFLTTPSFAAFTRAAKSLNINPENPKTAEEYDTLSQLYNAQTVDKNNLKDPERAERINTYTTILAEKFTGLESFITLLETEGDDPATRAQAISDIAALFNTITKLSEEMVTGTDFSQL